MAALPPKKPAPAAEPAITGELLPKNMELIVFSGISYEIAGTNIICSFDNDIARANDLHNKWLIEPETDDEISFRALQVKELKASEERLTEIDSEVTEKFTSLADFKKSLDELKNIIRLTRLIGEDQVKNSKARKIADIKARYQKIWDDEFSRLSKMVLPLSLSSVAKPDFQEAMKNKKTFASLEDAAKNQVAFCVQLAERVAINYAEKLKIIRANVGLQFLFADLQELVALDIAVLKDEVDSRVVAHQEAEAQKAEALRIKIAAEEKAKAEAKQLAELQKIEDERLAEQNRLEREARAKQAADDLAKAEALRKSAAQVNESALRAESNEAMRKEQATAEKMVETAKKLEAEAPKKLQTEMPSLQRVLDCIERKFFLVRAESEQLIVDLADEIEKLRYRHMHDPVHPGFAEAKPDDYE